MCETITKKLERHEENAVREMRVKLQAEQDKQCDLPPRNRRLRSTKTDKSDFCSMGGIGRMQNVGRTRRKEPSKEHRVKNVRSDEPNFKIGNQRLVSQSFASDLIQDNKDDEKQNMENCSSKEKKSF